MLIVSLNRLDSLIAGCRVNAMPLSDWSYLIPWSSPEEMSVPIPLSKKKRKKNWHWTRKLKCIKTLVSWQESIHPTSPLYMNYWYNLKRILNLFMPMLQLPYILYNVMKMYKSILKILNIKTRIAGALALPLER